MVEYKIEIFDEPPTTSELDVLANEECRLVSIVPVPVRIAFGSMVTINKYYVYFERRWPSGDENK